MYNVTHILKSNIHYVYKKKKIGSIKLYVIRFWSISNSVQDDLMLSVWTDFPKSAQPTSCTQPMKGYTSDIFID